MTEDQQYEELLARRITKGDDHHAFAEFYNRYRQRLLYFVNRLIKNDVEAEDIVNATFQKLWMLRTRFSTIADIRSFMYVTANNAGLNYLKYNYKGGAQRKNEIFIADIEGLAERQAGEPAFIYDFLDAELYARVYQEIQNLPPRQKQLIELALVGKSYAEIARALNIDEPAARQLKKRAVTNLRQKLLPLLEVMVYILLFERLISS